MIFAISTRLMLSGMSPDIEDDKNIVLYWQFVPLASFYFIQYGICCFLLLSSITFRIPISIFSQLDC
jgi:hypothetical protein